MSELEVCLTHQTIVISFNTVQNEKCIEPVQRTVWQPYLKAQYCWQKLKNLLCWLYLFVAWNLTYLTLFHSLAGKHLSDRHKQANSRLNVRIAVATYENISFSVNTGVARARTHFFLYQLTLCQAHDNYFGTKLVVILIPHNKSFDVDVMVWPFPIIYFLLG